MNFLELFSKLNNFFCFFMPEIGDEIAIICSCKNIPPFNTSSSRTECPSPFPFAGRVLTFSNSQRSLTTKVCMTRQKNIENLVRPFVFEYFMVGFLFDERFLLNFCDYPKIELPAIVFSSFYGGSCIA